MKLMYWTEITCGFEVELFSVFNKQCFQHPQQCYLQQCYWGDQLALRTHFGIMLVEGFITRAISAIQLMS
jgi:hypothetical protein